MPTYDYRCPHCGQRASEFQSIGEYIRAPRIPDCPTCPGLPAVPMRRELSVVPAMSGLANALAGDRHYDGLRAPDGADISSRSKHREYMRRTGLTDAGDFAGTWNQTAKERAELRQGTFKDKELRNTVAEQVYTAINKTE